MYFPEIASEILLKDITSGTRIRVPRECERDTAQGECERDTAQEFCNRTRLHLLIKTHMTCPRGLFFLCFAPDGHRDRRRKKQRKAIFGQTALRAKK